MCIYQTCYQFLSLAQASAEINSTATELLSTGPVVIDEMCSKLEAALILYIVCYNNNIFYWYRHPHPTILNNSSSQISLKWNCGALAARQPVSAGLLLPCCHAVMLRNASRGMTSQLTRLMNANRQALSRVNRRAYSTVNNTSIRYTRDLSPVPHLLLAHRPILIPYSLSPQRTA